MREIETRIAVISTVGINPGDEFIRLGQEYLLSQLFAQPCFNTVNKHDPRTLFSDFRPARYRPHRLAAPLLYRLHTAIHGSARCLNLLDKADLVLFAGTPFIWRQHVRLLRSTSANAEWIGPVWQRLFKELSQKPVLNLAAGTSVSNSGEIECIIADRSVRSFLIKAVARSTLTTARDLLTYQVLGRLGFDIPLLPCTSLFASRGAGIQAHPAQYVVFNVMPKAVHTGRGRHTDPARWRATASALVTEIERRFPVLFISHSVDEDAAVARWFPGRKRLFSRDPRILLEAYSKAVYGVCNRVHAAAAVASFGRPALVIGGDSRVQLIREFGLPAFDHRQLDAISAVDAVRMLESDYSNLRHSLVDQIHNAEIRYLSVISSALAGVLL